MLSDLLLIWNELLKQSWNLLEISVFATNIKCKFHVVLTHDIQNDDNMIISIKRTHKAKVTMNVSGKKYQGD